MESHSLAAPPVSLAAGPLRVARRYLDRYGLIVALAALPVYYAVKDLTSGYPAFVNGRAVVHHDLAYLGGNLVLVARKPVAGTMPVLSSRSAT